MSPTRVADPFSCIPVLSSVNAAVSDEDFHRQVFQMAEDCVSQGGVTHLVVIHPAAESDGKQRAR